MPRLQHWAYDSRITTSRCGWVVHRAGPGEPPPLRGAARVLRRGADPRAGRRTVRLHKVGDGEPGPRVPQAREAIAFCDHWKAVSGADPHMLVKDQKVTTQHVLAELDDRGVKFLTLRMRSPTLIHIEGLTSADYKTISLDRSGRFNRPPGARRAHPALEVPRPLWQVIVTGLGREAPTVIITNDHDSTAKALIRRYARPMTTEQRLAEIIAAFHADALSSTVNLNVDLDITLDITLCVLAQALTAALRQRLPGHANVTPDVLQRRFLETPGTITTTPRHGHRPPRPTRPRTRPATSRPAQRHHRPLVGQPHPPLRHRLIPPAILPTLAAARHRP
jgi:hypothetical protein